MYFGPSHTLQYSIFPFITFTCLIFSPFTSCVFVCDIFSFIAYFRLPPMFAKYMHFLLFRTFSFHVFSLAVLSTILYFLSYGAFSLSYYRLYCIFSPITYFRFISYFAFFPITHLVHRVLSYFFHITYSRLSRIFACHVYFVDRILRTHSHDFLEYASSTNSKNIPVLCKLEHKYPYTNTDTEKNTHTHTYTQSRTLNLSRNCMLQSPQKTYSGHVGTIKVEIL